jgi:hypothetical protein
LLGRRSLLLGSCLLLGKEQSASFTLSSLLFEKGPPGCNPGRRSFALCYNGV